MFLLLEGKLCSYCLKVSCVLIGRLSLFVSVGDFCVLHSGGICSALSLLSCLRYI